MRFVGSLWQCLLVVFRELGLTRGSVLEGNVFFNLVLLMDICLLSGALPCVDFRLERESVPHIGTINTSVEMRGEEV